MHPKIIERWPQLADYSFHPYAAIMPLPLDSYESFLEYVEADEFSSFAADVKNGLKEPIILYQNQILSGRRRFCTQVVYPDIELRYEVFNGDDKSALELSASVNMMRRNLSDSQKALAANRIYTLELEVLSPKERETLEVVARRYNIGITLIKYANQLMKANNSKLINSVDSGLLPLKKAVDCLKLPNELVDQILDGDASISSELDKALRHQGYRKRQNAFTLETIKENRENQAKAKDLVYGVIYCDPPWHLKTGMTDKSVENHYPTMSDDDIRAIKIPAASDCALFLWATVPKLDTAIDIMQAWGFTYKTAFFWHKTKIGMGHWTRNTVEVLLLGTIGSPPAPLFEEAKMDQMISAAQGKHSEKPKVFADGITMMFPTVPKLEMFARETNNKGENWYYWGNEVGVEIEKPKKRRNGNGKKKEAAADSESMEFD